MSVSALETHEEKEQWLIRPIRWVYSISFFCGFMGLIQWFGGADAEILLVLSLGVNITAAGLSLFGIRRIMRAARGYY